MTQAQAPLKVSPQVDAWEKRMERVMRGEEDVTPRAMPAAPAKPLEQQYAQENTYRQEEFQRCFNKVFAGRTYDGGVPYKSEGQGYRIVISVNNGGLVSWWTINRSILSCKQRTTPSQDYLSAKIGQQVEFDRSPFNSEAFRIGKWVFEGDELCRYEKHSSLKGVTRKCYRRLPDYIPG